MSTETEKVRIISICRLDEIDSTHFLLQVQIDDCGVIKVDKPFAVSTAAVSDDV